METGVPDCCVRKRKRSEAKRALFLSVKRCQALGGNGLGSKKEARAKCAEAEFTQMGGTTAEDPQWGLLPEELLPQLPFVLHARGDKVPPLHEPSG